MPIFRKSCAHLGFGVHFNIWYHAACPVCHFVLIRLTHSDLLSSAGNLVWSQVDRKSLPRERRARTYDGRSGSGFGWTGPGWRQATGKLTGSPAKSILIGSGDTMIHNSDLLPKWVIKTAIWLKTAAIFNRFGGHFEFESILFVHGTVYWYHACSCVILIIYSKNGSPPPLILDPVTEPFIELPGQKGFYYVYMDIP